MAFDVHVFTGRDGTLSASMTLSDGVRTKPRKLTNRQAGALMELMHEHRLYASTQQEARRARKGKVTT
jgi:hypothetical protein